MMENGSNEERDFLTPSPSLEPAEDSLEQGQTSQGPLSIQAEEVAEVRVEPSQVEELSSGGESDRETELTRVRVSSYFESVKAGLITSASGKTRGSYNHQ